MPPSPLQKRPLSKAKEVNSWLLSLQGISGILKDNFVCIRGLRGTLISEPHPAQESEHHSLYNPVLAFL